MLEQYRRDLAHHRSSETGNGADQRNDRFAACAFATKQSNRLSSKAISTSATPKSSAGTAATSDVARLPVAKSGTDAHRQHGRYQRTPSATSSTR